MENQPQANTPAERKQESKLTFEDHVIKKLRLFRLRRSTAFWK